MSKTVQIISHIDDIKNIDKKNTIFCFDISLQNELRKKNIKFLSSLNLLKTSDYQKIIDLTQKIRKNFFNDLKEIDGVNYSKSLNSLFSFKIKFYVNCLAVQILIIKKIIKKYKPKTLRISRSVNKKLIIKNDYFFSFFLKKFLKKENVQIISKIQLRKNDKRKISFVFKNFIFFLINCFTKIINRIFYNNKKAILVLSTDYGLDIFAKKVLKKNKDYSLMFLEYGKILSSIKIFFNRIFYYSGSQKKISEIEQDKIILFYKKKIIKKNNIFKFQGLNFGKEVLDYFQLILANEIFLYKEQIDSAEDFFNKKRPKLIISHSSYGMGHFLAEFSQYYKIPSLVVSHGTHTVHNDKRLNFEWYDSARHLMGLSKVSFDYISAQSPLINKFLLKNANPKKIIKTGPIIFKYKKEKQLNKKFIKKSKKKTILHASTPKSLTNLRPITFETNEEYIKQINLIISVIDKIDNFHLIIKFRTTYGLNYETFKKSLIDSNNYTISINESLETLLDSSDCLISYSSTVIEEMLNYKKPVILFDSFKRYCHVTDKFVKNNLKFKLAPINYLTNTLQLKRSLESLNYINLKKFQKNKFWSQFVYPVDKNIDWIENIKF